MPQETVYITELEAAILKVFTDRGLLSDRDIAHELKALVEKLGK